jgi:transposase
LPLVKTIGYSTRTLAEFIHLLQARGVSRVVDVRTVLRSRHTGETFAQWVKGLRPKLTVEVVKRSDDTSGFKVLPRRWVVERTFGWLMRQRRLVRDYETTETSAEAWICIAMIRIQLRRLA